MLPDLTDTDAAIDAVIAACNGDLRGAVKALLLVNEQLEAELFEIIAAMGRATAILPATNALH